ncbi:MAG: glycosyltransferase family 4 protein [Patescibacteria group bacterium]|nr:glycosyltransferase family 4 protein [Patescibacteria group bacterium]
MRILIATGLYPPDIGGPATYSKFLKEELPKGDIEVLVCSFGEVRHLLPLVRHIVYFFKVLRAGRSADLFLALDPVSVGFPATLVSLLLRKPLVVKIVGDYAWEQGTRRFGITDTLDDFVVKPARHPFVLLLRSTQRMVARRAKHIIVPSVYLKRIVTAWGMTEKKISVIYNAFDAVTYTKEEKDEIRALLDISNHAILSAGRLVPWKGFAALIEIMPGILEEFPDATLFIAGEGPDRTAFETLIKKHNLGGHVRMLGGLPQETLFRYITAADVFVLNTGYEGFSHQLLEVMSTGTPIIATDVGGNPELIETGVEGILVSYNNKAELESAIREMLRGHIDGRALARNAQKKVMQFTKERMLAETKHVLMSQI